jgi:multimeric flavodoxin WrbA
MFDWLKSGGKIPAPRKGMPSPQLDEADLKRRFRIPCRDQAFDALQVIADAAWEAYSDGRKSPHTRKAGPGFADPDYDLSLDWIEAREAIGAAQRRHDDAGGPLRVLLINGSSRSEHTCPGEMSKSFRLAEIARGVFAQGGAQVDLLDLSRLASEYGRRIHPCKACFSTAAALCHWPCSCYPNYSLGQTPDWMNEIYPQWVAAHGVMIVTPVNWYAAPSPLKLMMDRMVCADGGNPDPTTTHGKDPAKAKALELAGWDYPRPLAGRLFAVVVHGDAEGAGGAEQQIADWLISMHLQSAGNDAQLDRYIGYWKPYALSHEELDADEAVREEARNAALTLLAALRIKRTGRWPAPDAGLTAPRDK